MKDKLTPEDIRLWKLNVRDVKPLTKTTPLPEELKEPKKVIPQKTTPKKSVHTPPSPLPLQTFGRKDLRHVKIDGRLDMHGMSLEKGYEALKQFLIRAQERGYKKVLVITGKGALSAENTFRHQLPRWLEETPLRQFITSYHSARPKDGGPGAFYVRIRKGK